MKCLVIDSSVAVKWLNRQDEKNIQESDQLLEDLSKNKIQINMPELAKYEIGNALLNKKVDLPKTKVTLEKFYAIPINFIPDNEKLAQRTAEIADVYNMTYYDGSFISLAEHLNADLITDNPKHQGRYRDKKIQIIPLKNYK